MQVAKWGNSLAVRLPASIVEALKLRAGDDVEIHVAAERVLPSKNVRASGSFLTVCGNIAGSCLKISALTG